MLKIIIFSGNVRKEISRKQCVLCVRVRVYARARVCTSMPAHIFKCNFIVMLCAIYLI